MSADPRYATRERKAEKVLAILRDYAGGSLEGCVCLDVGCAGGGITRRLAGEFRRTIGVDLDWATLRAARREGRSPNLEYAVASGQQLPFADGAVEVVVCAQVYEHVSNPRALAGEIWRVLRPGGICFFSGPNRLALMEEHYWLPLLSWLPRPLAHLYMRAFRRGRRYDAWPLFYWQVRALWRRFTIHDYTLRLIREPGRFALEEKVGRLAWIGRAPVWLLRLLTPLLPNYNWILVKPP